ncbi:MAG TPA: TIGR03618 family F420-dependent PPOX class oxidoreductase [Chloroflexia bacterium]|nr:TIGR03618 family F420-dependent PPOX class oxidoreductase [Chloroflexia bacterium]
METAKFSERQLAYLSYPHYAVMATINADHSPQLSTVWFGFNEDRTKLVFVIERDSLKMRNIQRDPRFAASIPHGGRYVVVRGRAEFDLAQDPTQAQEDLEKLGQRYYGPIEGHNQVLSFGEKERVTVYLVPEKISSVGV